MVLELLKKIGIEIVWPGDASQAQGSTQNQDKPLKGRALQRELEQKAKALEELHKHRHNDPPKAKNITS